MIMNYDCIRDILIALENLLVYDDRGYLLPVSDDKIYDYISNKQYTFNDVFYSLSKMYESGLIDAIEIKTLGGHGFKVKDITYLGHQYLASIKSNTVWTKVKSTILKNGGTATLDMIMKLGTKYLSQILGI